jgi:hypothetical protein
MAQTPAGSTFYSHQNGNWNDISTWSLKSNNLDAPTRIPNETDYVEITSGRVVMIPTGTFTCATLKIHSGGGNPKAGGEVVIGTGESTAAKLTTNNLFFTRATGQPKERATLRMRSNGHITINNRVNIVDNKDASVSNPLNTDIFYSFNANSIIEYGGGDQALFNFSVVTVVDETSTSYPNLILSGSGVKTATANKEVRGNLTVNGTAAFSLGSFSHTINGNLNVSSISASIIGNSTEGLSLTVGGNVINSGNIAFQTRVLSVGGNFTNNIGGIFTAGGGTHTISGNWTNNGTFSAGAGTIALNGLSKTISSTGTGAFNNLTISGGSKSLLSNIRVNGSLGLSNAILNTGPSKVVLGNAATVFRRRDCYAEYNRNSRNYASSSIWCRSDFWRYRVCYY